MRQGYDFFLIAMIGLLLNGCETNCTKTGPIQIEQVEMPDTVLVNQATPIDVQAYAPNGCWENLMVELKNEENFKPTLSAIGNFNCCGDCVCTHALVYKDTTINFLPDQKGVYIFEIVKLNGVTDSDTLVVQ